jgi:hypothetical protein
VDEDPPRIELNYSEPVSVFPTNTKDSILFWGCFTVLMCFLGAVALLGFWALLWWH